MVSEKDFCSEQTQTTMEGITNIITDTYERSMQYAVMSGLEDENSSQFFTRPIINKISVVKA